jgi:hypothetical protein
LQEWGRLARRGLAPSALALVLVPTATSAAVPAPLFGVTVQAATLVAAGHATAGALSAPVAALTEGVLRAMRLSRIKLAVAVVLTAGVLGAGWGVYQSRAAGQPPAPEAAPAGSAGSAAAVAPAAQAAEMMNLPAAPPRSRCSPTSARTASW